MDLSLAPEQEMLQRTAREFLERECSTKVARAMEVDETGYPPAVWRQIADLGWLGLPFPENLGGGGGSLLDTVLLLEEMGRVVAPLPYQATVMQAGLAILFAGSEAQRRAYLPTIARGERLVSYAHVEPGRGPEPRHVGLKATRHGDGWKLDGDKILVEWAHVAEDILVLARTGAPGPDGTAGLTLFLVPRSSPGLVISPVTTVAEGKSFDIAFNGVEVSADRVLGEPGSGWQVLVPAQERAIVARCAEMTGMAAAAQAMSVQYAKDRVAFGRPIGAFQAIQHKLVEMQNLLDGMRLATYHAAWRIDEGMPAAYWVSIAKAQASRAIRVICFEGHEIHAGLGFMREYDLQLYYRRAKVAEIEFGDFNHHARQAAGMLRHDSSLGRIAF